jgi:hypothetical protein
MKPYERMFYIAITIGLLIKFPWLIGMGLIIGIFLAVVIDNSDEDKQSK